MNKNIGYACINTQLSSEGIKTGRSIRLANFSLSEASDRAVRNMIDLVSILEWNRKNGFEFFRIGSDVAPRWDHYELHDLPDYAKLLELGEKVEQFHKTGMRLTFHPDHFMVLGSSNPDVVDRTIVGLERHSDFMDICGFEYSPYNKINIHVNTAKPSRQAVADRWVAGFERLSPRCQSRITLENDDRANAFSVKDLYELIYPRTGVPIVFDYHHHKFNTGGLSAEDALELAMSTWPDGITPVVHYSESRKEEMIRNGIDPGKTQDKAHSDYIESLPDIFFSHDVDIMVEAKMKEQTILQWKLNRNISHEHGQILELAK